jgi:hypothetical protein
MFRETVFDGFVGPRRWRQFAWRVTFGRRHAETKKRLSHLYGVRETPLSNALLQIAPCEVLSTPQQCRGCEKVPPGLRFLSPANSAAA